MDLDQLRTRYRGSTASSYENRRRDREKWHREQDAVEAFLERIVTDVDEPLILDVPVGTGRFFDLYELFDVRAVGVDVSEDMLEEARTKIDEDSTGISLKQGDIMDLSSLDISPDAVVCIRFMNWLDTPDVKDALASIAGTSTTHVVIGIRVQDTPVKRLTGRLRELYQTVSRTRDSKTTVHEEDRILEYFADCGFRVEESELVDEWLFGDKYIYWLTK